MGNPLQLRRTPQEFAESGQTIEIASKIVNFERLTEVVEEDLGALDADMLPSDWRDAVVTGQLSFGFAAAQGNLPVAVGQVAVRIAAICQRCLRPFDFELQTKLSVVFGDQQTVVAEGSDYEVWELQDGELCPTDLIDEVLVMALPIAATHANDANCKAEFAADEKLLKMTTPFANLKSQMDTEN